MGKSVTQAAAQRHPGFPAQARRTVLRRGDTRMPNPRPLSPEVPTDERDELS